MIDDRFKIQEQQEAGDRWLQQRAQFRRENHERLRREEGLPQHDGEKYVVGDKRVGLAVGKVQGSGAGKPIIDGIADAASHAAGGFSHVDDNPNMLARELRDLERDARALELSEGVRYFETETGTPMEAANFPSDEEADRWMQAEIKKRMESESR